MFGLTKKTSTSTETRGRKKMSKKDKILNLLQRGQSVSWKALNTTYGLKSPRSMVDTLRAEGFMIYGSKSKGKHVYRMGTPTRAIISAGIKALYGTPFKYDNASTVAPTKATVASIDAQLIIWGPSGPYTTMTIGYGLGLFLIGTILTVVGFATALIITEKQKTEKDEKSPVDDLLGKIK